MKNRAELLRLAQSLAPTAAQPPLPADAVQMLRRQAAPNPLAVAAMSPGDLVGTAPVVTKTP
jgi:hypothetical protein